MTPYELADLLETTETTNNKAATMLRQQAEKINNMEIWEKKYLDRIAELEKTMGEHLNDLNTRQVEDASTSLVSTPPYAYAVIQGNDNMENVSLQFDHPEMCGQIYKQAIPLYTHKELSDKEIICIWNNCETSEDFEEFIMEDFILFARAIIKASRGEK